MVPTMSTPDSVGLRAVQYTAYGRIFTAVIRYEDDHDPYRKPKSKTVDGTANL